MAITSLTTMRSHPSYFEVVSVVIRVVVVIIVAVVYIFLALLIGFSYGQYKFN